MVDVAEIVGGAADGAAVPDSDAGVGVAGGGGMPGGTITRSLGYVSPAWGS